MKIYKSDIAPDMLGIVGVAASYLVSRAWTEFQLTRAALAEIAQHHEAYMAYAEAAEWRRKQLSGRSRVLSPADGVLTITGSKDATDFDTINLGPQTPAATGGTDIGYSFNVAGDLAEKDTVFRVGEGTATLMTLDGNGNLYVPGTITCGTPPKPCKLH